MARRSGSYGYEKRQKELKKLKKKAEKRQKKLEKDKSAGGPEIDYSLCTTAEAAGVDLAELIEKQEAEKESEDDLEADEEEDPSED